MEQMPGGGGDKHVGGALAVGAYRIQPKSEEEPDSRCRGLVSPIREAESLVETPRPNCTLSDAAGSEVSSIDACWRGYFSSGLGSEAGAEDIDPGRDGGDQGVGAAAG